MLETNLPALDNFMSPEFIANPYPIYERLRQEDPVHWNDLLKVWVVTSYADVATCLSDPRFSSDWAWTYNFGRPLTPDEEAPMFELRSRFSNFIQGMDPPAHTRQRALFQKAFTPRVIEGLRPLVEQTVNELLDKVVASGQFDLVRDLAVPLPATIILKMLDIPAEGWSYVQASSECLAEFFTIIIPREGQLAHISDTILRCEEYLKTVIAERRANPGTDLLSLMIKAEEDGEALNDKELLGACTLLLFGGHETTTNMIEVGLLNLLTHPDQLALLRANPQLLPGAIEELLRHDSIFQLLGRRVREETTLSGTLLEPGQRILLALAGANRDPGQFSDPNRLDITRSGTRHLTFAYGVHFCLGAALARLELHLVFATLLERFADLQLAEETVHWRPNFVLRGLTSLPLNFKLA